MSDPLQETRLLFFPQLWIIVDMEMEFLKGELMVDETRANAKAFIQVSDLFHIWSNENRNDPSPAVLHGHKSKVRDAENLLKYYPSVCQHGVMQHHWLPTGHFHWALYSIFIFGFEQRPSNRTVAVPAGMVFIRNAWYDENEYPEYSTNLRQGRACFSTVILASEQHLFMLPEAPKSFHDSCQPLVRRGSPSCRVPCQPVPQTIGAINTGYNQPTEVKYNRLYKADDPTVDHSTLNVPLSTATTMQPTLLTQATAPPAYVAPPVDFTTAKHSMYGPTSMSSQGIGIADAGQLAREVQQLLDPTPVEDRGDCMVSSQSPAPPVPAARNMAAASAGSALSTPTDARPLNFLFQQQQVQSTPPDSGVMLPTYMGINPMIMPPSVQIPQPTIQNVNMTGAGHVVPPPLFAVPLIPALRRQKRTKKTPKLPTKKKAT
jgi:hypothetical protein